MAHGLGAFERKKCLKDVFLHLRLKLKYVFKICLLESSLYFSRFLQTAMRYAYICVMLSLSVGRLLMATLATLRAGRLKVRGCCSIQLCLQQLSEKIHIFLIKIHILRDIPKPGNLLKLFQVVRSGSALTLSQGKKIQKHEFSS